MRKNDNIDFDYFYSEQKSYFGIEPSDGLVDMLKKYPVTVGNALDIGAGEGRNSIYLSQLGFKVTSIEPTFDGANKIIERAKELNLKINVINNDYLGDTTNEKYDFIIAGTSLDHMDKDYLDKAIIKLKNSLNINGLVYIVVFTQDDPGYLKDLDNASECASFIKHYFSKNELRDYFNDFDILYYNEYIKPDNSHGKPHVHGKAKLIARKIK